MHTLSVTNEWFDMSMGDGVSGHPKADEGEHQDEADTVRLHQAQGPGCESHTHYTAQLAY